MREQDTFEHVYADWARENEIASLVDQLHEARELSFDLFLFGVGFLLMLVVGLFLLH